MNGIYTPPQTLIFSPNTILSSLQYPNHIDNEYYLNHFYYITYSDCYELARGFRLPHNYHHLLSDFSSNTKYLIRRTKYFFRRSIIFDNVKTINGDDSV